jgi:hypothetical protein
MTKGKKYTIIAVSTLVVSGLGYFIYQKIKMSILNSKVSTIYEAEQKIDNIDTENVSIPEDASTEPVLPMPSPDFSKDQLIETTDDGGYY